MTAGTLIRNSLGGEPIFKLMKLLWVLCLETGGAEASTSVCNERRMMSVKSHKHVRAQVIHRKLSLYSTVVSPRVMLSMPPSLNTCRSSSGSSTATETDRERPGQTVFKSPFCLPLGAVRLMWHISGACGDTTPRLLPRGVGGGGGSRLARKQRRMWETHKVSGVRGPGWTQVVPKPQLKKKNNQIRPFRTKLKDKKPKPAQK